MKTNSKIIIAVCLLVTGLLAAETEAKVQLRFLFPDSEATNSLELHLQKIQEQYNIEVLQQQVPNTEFYKYLLTQIVGGNAPDIAILSGDRMARFQDWLQPLDDSLWGNDFLPGALKSARINGEVYGLPWRRFLCTPYYAHLVIFRTTKYPEEASQVIKFLTLPEQQLDYFQEKNSWYPTRMSMNKELSGCSEFGSSLADIPVNYQLDEQARQSADIINQITSLEERLRLNDELNKDMRFNLDYLHALPLKGLEKRDSFTVADIAEVVAPGCRPTGVVSGTSNIRFLSTGDDYWHMGDSEIRKYQYTA